MYMQDHGRDSSIYNLQITFNNTWEKTEDHE